MSARITLSTDSMPFHPQVGVGIFVDTKANSTDLSSMNSKTDDIARDTTLLVQEFVKAAISQAYDEGVAAGRAAAKAEIAADMKAAIDGIQAQLLTFGTDTSVDANSVQSGTSVNTTRVSRAPRGSAPPLILEILRKNERGMTTKEVYGELSDKLEENTVRGTLNRLRHEGKVARWGDRWAVPKEYRQPLSATTDSGSE